MGLWILEISCCKLWRCENWGMELFTEIYLLGQWKETQLFWVFGLATFLNLFIPMTIKMICQLLILETRNKLHSSNIRHDVLRKKKYLGLDANVLDRAQWSEDVLKKRHSYVCKNKICDLHPPLKKGGKWAFHHRKPIFVLQTGKCLKFFYFW